MLAGVVVSNFARNFSHLIGVHLLTAQSAKQHLDLSAQAISELRAGKRQPSLQTLQKTSGFFEISIDRLLEAEFEDLLANELADSDRFRRVEAKIGRGPHGLRVVE
jgi:transcriptional regulator with XRE-family HTH domain